MLVTQIISAMTVMICMLVDNIMIGRFLGVPSMTAYGLVTPVLLVFAAVGSMISAGIQVMCGKTMGNGDREATNACFTASVFLASIVSFGGLALCLIFASPLSTMLGAGTPSADNEVFYLTKDYLIGFITCAPAFVFAQIMIPYMQISGNRKRLVTAVALMTFADIAGDILNVFVFKGGIFGMGLASSISYYVAFTVGILYFFKKDCIFKFRKKLLDRASCLTLLKYGIPTVINQICLVLIVFVFNKLLLSVRGDDAVAAYSVISTIGNLCYSFGTGIATVALMLSAIFYSDKDKTALRLLVKTMVYYAVVINAVVTGVILLAAPPLIDLFLKSKEETRELAILGLRLFSLSLIPCALNTSLKNYYQGVNRTRFTEIISVLQNFAITALFAFILSYPLGTTGVWLGFLCGETVTLLIISIVVWIRNKKVSFSVNAYSLLPDGFGVDDKDCFEEQITGASDVVAVSQKASDFCVAHKQTPKFCYMIALCIEEMTNNIVKHGFTADGKEHNIDVRLMIKDDERIIRIRDNCVNFDPVKYMELHAKDDAASHIGIRMVMSVVKDANYVNSLGLNNLTLKI